MSPEGESAYAPSNTFVLQQNIVNEWVWLWESNSQLLARTNVAVEYVANIAEERHREVMFNMASTTNENHQQAMAQLASEANKALHEQARGYADALARHQREAVLKAEDISNYMSAKQAAETNKLIMLSTKQCTNGTCAGKRR